MKYKEIDVIKASKERLILAGTKHILEYIRNEFNKFQQKGLIITDISLKAVYFDYVPIATILALDSLYSYSVVWATTEEFAKQIQIKSKAIIDSYVDYALSPSFQSEIIKDPIPDSEFGSPIISVYPHTNIMDISHELFKDTKISLENVCVNIDSRIKNLSEIVNKQWIDGAYYWNYKSTLKYNEYKQNVDNYIFKTKDPKIVAGLTHYLYDRYLLSNDSANEETIYFNIPIIGANVDSLEIEYKGQAVAFCYLVFENPNRLNIADYIRNFAKHISPVIDYNIKNVIFNLLYGVTNKLQEKIKKESLKSAKAAIMSRNMSHNLGSHVMFYIKQKLQSVSKIVDSKVLDNIIPGKIPDIAAVEAAIKANKGIELPFLVGLGRFINYLQERQDYIATIATDYIPANSTISFKDFIYDELKPELRYQRHHSKSDDAGWKSGNLLLDYIAYSEGYRSCDKIEILFGEFNGSSPVKDTNPDKDFQKLREFNIAVPGGVIGRQALFSIFENIIRNAAKHSERRSDNKLVLQLSLLEKDSVLFTEDEFRAKRNDDKVDYDKCGLDLKKLYANYFDRYHFLRIKVDMPNPDGVIDTLVDNLADPYIDDNGAMKETTKGLKEMRISAAWLRGKSIDTEIPADEPPALSIYTEPYSKDNSKVTISYILCIPKPCRVAFVVECDNRDILNDLLTPYGCKVFIDSFKLKDEENRDKLINEIANYEIVCMSEDNRDLCSRISSRYIANQDRSAELLEDLKGAITKDYEEKLKQEAEQAQIEAEKDPTEENKKKLKSANEKLSKIDEIKKGVIEDAIGSIYEEWFNTTNNSVTPKLVVADGKAVQNNKKESGSLSSDDNVILTNTGKITSVDNASTQNSENANDASVTLSERIVTKDDVKGAVVYSTHFKGLSSKSEGPDGYNTWLQDAICIESVTGNNSTARLIRQDEWTKEWKTKILSAGMARVAIFDERIFSSFISRESVLKYDNVSIEDIKTLITEYKSKEQTEEVLLEFCQKMDDEYGINDNDSSDIYYDFKTIDDVINCLEITYHYDIAQKNHERRIWAFDIIVPKEVDGIVEIVGYNVHIGDCVGAYSEHKTDAIITIAKISRYCELGQYDIKLCDDKKVFATGNSNIFDYISIHQGVLDKIYTAFGIKNDEDEKYKVTNALHKCFSKQDTPMDAKEFLPNFIIHSGRSKPSKNDMPQKQPFVQFAAVDHAVKDCKYTLVELLATAHYEKSDNNN